MAQDQVVRECDLLGELDRADFVTGWRVVRHDSWLRQFSSRTARWARKRVLGVDFRDTGSGFKVFKRTALANVVAFKGLHRFLPILAYWGAP